MAHRAGEVAGSGFSASAQWFVLESIRLGWTHLLYRRRVATVRQVDVVSDAAWGCGGLKARTGGFPEALRGGGFSAAR